MTQSILHVEKQRQTGQGAAREEAQRALSPEPFLHMTRVSGAPGGGCVKVAPEQQRAGPGAPWGLGPVRQPQAGMRDAQSRLGAMFLQALGTQMGLRLRAGSASACGPDALDHA